ncbi:hypothetical protein BDN70DRAFT_902191 [Pholiota conissans]|uniref:Uncharacterized protein n=1 Tax=Pholiota conissans TaxID=109636 RepID=A0A9P6CS81_9AGAR|nr:hypothetical protein BDN70DRAFT_902191 [Pholiota conissans]
MYSANGERVLGSCRRRLCAQAQNREGCPMYESGMVRSHRTRKEQGWREPVATDGKQEQVRFGVDGGACSHTDPNLSRPSVRHHRFVTLSFTFDAVLHAPSSAYTLLELLVRAAAACSVSGTTANAPSLLPSVFFANSEPSLFLYAGYHVVEQYWTWIGRKGSFIPKTQAAVARCHSAGEQADYNVKDWF